MFERYTETARIAVFMGRYEASRFGSKSIESHHLLLGIIRADPALASRVFESKTKIEELRKRLEEESPPTGEKVPTGVDLPLSAECKRALVYATAIAAAVSSNRGYIDSAHMLLGLAQEKGCLAARALGESGVSAGQLEKQIKEAETSSNVSSPSTGGPNQGSPAQGLEGVRDLTADAREGLLTPLVGRQREMEQVLRILARRSKSSPLLIGEAGVGKHAILCGLAQSMAKGDVPADLEGRRLVMVDGWALARALPALQSREPAHSITLQETISEMLRAGGTVLYIRGLLTLDGTSRRAVLQFLEGGSQVIATGSPAALRMILMRDESLLRSFEVVSVLPPDRGETLRIVSALKEALESFHAVSVSEDVVEMAVRASERFLRHLALPEGALDLIDDAGARSKIERERQPPEIKKLQQRLKVVAREMEQAIAKHEFERAVVLSDEENQSRAAIARLRAELQTSVHDSAITADDVLEAVADRTSLTVPEIKAALERAETPDRRDELVREVAAHVPIGRGDWVEGFSSFLADCSSDDAERFLQALRTAKLKFDRGR